MRNAMKLALYSSPIFQFIMWLIAIDKASSTKLYDIEALIELEHPEKRKEIDELIRKRYEGRNN